MFWESVFCPVFVVSDMFMHRQDTSVSWQFVWFRCTETLRWRRWMSYKNCNSHQTMKETSTNWAFTLTVVGVVRVSWHNWFFLSPTIHWEFPPKQGACLGKALCQPLSFLGVLWRAAYVQGTLWAFDTWCCFQRLFPRFWSHFGLKL